MRIFMPLRSATVLISLRYQRQLCAVLPQGSARRLVLTARQCIMPRRNISRVLLAPLRPNGTRAERKSGVFADVVVRRGMASLDGAVRTASSTCRPARSRPPQKCESGIYFR